MSKILVSYFSASGTTRSVSEKLAKAIGADIYEIKPEVPYTSADLDWTNKKSRSTVEMNDKKFRPAIADADANIAQYDTVFVGFPVWWYTAPTIINTFLESYDFSGKKIVLFATSGGSGLGSTKKDLQPSVSDTAEIVNGKVLSRSAGETELADWAKDFIVSELNNRT